MQARDQDWGERVEGQQEAEDINHALLLTCVHMNMYDRESKNEVKGRGARQIRLISQRARQLKKEEKREEKFLKK